MPTKSNEAQKKRLDRFFSAFNLIDRSIRKKTGSDRVRTSFGGNLKAYEESHRFGGSGDFLRSVAELRNVLVHERVKPHLELAIPTEKVVSRLEELAQQISNPPRLLSSSQGKVEQVEMADSLQSVLNLINERDYSQFPVYDGDCFQGLLTENGITRWLAHHVTNSASIVDFEDVPIREVLKEEEKRSNYKFVRRSYTWDRAVQLFREQELLEAIFITDSGKKTESLLGIATRWDILQMGK